MVVVGWQLAVDNDTFQLTVHVDSILLVEHSLVFLPSLEQVQGLQSYHLIFDADLKHKPLDGLGVLESGHGDGHVAKEGIGLVTVELTIAETGRNQEV